MGSLSVNWMGKVPGRVSAVGVWDFVRVLQGDSLKPMSSHNKSPSSIRVKEKLHQRKVRSVWARAIRGGFQEEAGTEAGSAG